MEPYESSKKTFDELKKNSLTTMCIVFVGGYV